ncbi:replication-associated protein [Pacific flying fox faeces associated circular DNA virus-11]|nr:replication-associated protein [Pacific flying fox faeces associated circular DNA virus-11]
MSKPSRNFCFTLNNPDDEYTFFADRFPRFQTQYAIWQLEAGENGTRDLQGYLELSSPARVSAFQSTTLKGAHFEPRKGTRAQARDYCRKLDTRVDGPWEYGTFGAGGQGRRSDLEAVEQSIKRGASLAEIAEEHTTSFIKYARNISLTCEILCPTTPRNPETPCEVHLYHGPSGCGKTRAITADSLLQGSSVYWKDNGKWWDGYRGHTIVVADDFSGASMRYCDFRRWFDRYPCRVERKGDTTELVATRFYISSTKLPDLWWDRSVVKEYNWMEIARRITHFHTFDEETKHLHSYTGTDQATALDQYCDSINYYHY